jgi:hypothetical protein
MEADCCADEAGMDLTSAAVNLKHAQVIVRVQMSVARKLLDAQEMQGAAAVKLIEAAGKIGTSARDGLVAAATGVGGELDTYG